VHRRPRREVTRDDEEQRHPENVNHDQDVNRNSGCCDVAIRPRRVGIALEAAGGMQENAEEHEHTTKRIEPRFPPLRRLGHSLPCVAAPRRESRSPTLMVAAIVIGIDHTHAINGAATPDASARR
jgi:hypothetical protein